MKCILFILSVYLLLLPLLPCMEQTTGAPHTTAETSAGQEDPDEHEHEKDDCNPFCSCSCCGTVLASCSPSAGLTGIRPLLKPQKYLLYNSIFLAADYFGNIWQPPKV